MTNFNELDPPYATPKNSLPPTANLGLIMYNTIQNLVLLIQYLSINSQQTRLYLTKSIFKAKADKQSL